MGLLIELMVTYIYLYNMQVKVRSLESTQFLTFLYVYGVFGSSLLTESTDSNDIV